MRGSDDKGRTGRIIRVFNGFPKCARRPRMLSPPIADEGRRELRARPRPVLLRSAAAVPYYLAAAFASLYATGALLQHRRMLTHAYDLGLFEQVVRNYAHLRAPVSDIREPGFNTLGEHFHPILAVLAPVYRLFPDPRTLLIAQALLLALSVVPVTRMGMRAFGTRGGATIGVAYGLSWGIQSAAMFEFHEVCFAVPMLAFGLEQLLRGRYRSAVAWLVPLVLVKEDLGLTVAAASAALAARRRRRLALLAVAFGSAAFVTTVFVVIPAVNPDGTYPFWDTVQATPSDDGTRQGLASVPVTQRLIDLPHDLILPDAKWMTLITLFLLSGFLALRSPIAVMLVPTLLWRFTSDNEYYWGTAFHYSAVLMPIVFAAFVDAAVTLRTSRRDWARRYAARAVAVPLAVSLALCRAFPLIDLLHHRTWTVEQRVEEAHTLLDRIPDGAQVSSTERLAPHLTSRTRVTDFPTVLPGPGYVIADSWDDNERWVPQWIDVLKQEGFHEIAVLDSGLVLLER